MKQTDTNKNFKYIKTDWESTVWNRRVCVGSLENLDLGKSKVETRKNKGMT